MNIYYPSCSFNRLDPQSAKALLQYAKAKHFEIAGCCQFDKHEPEDNTAIYFCQRCRETTEAKGFATKSFWEIIDEDETFPFPDYKGMQVTLQDCYRDRHKPEIHQAVRNLLTKMNIDYREANKNKQDSIYCGTLHYESSHPELPHDHLSHLDKDLVKQLMKENVDDYPTKLIAVTCCRCYNGILLGQGHPVHMMTLLMNKYIGREEELEAHALDLLSKPDFRDKWKRDY